jgi:hypothetical protein
MHSAWVGSVSSECTSAHSAWEPYPAFPGSFDRLHGAGLQRVLAGRPKQNSRVRLKSDIHGKGAGDA